MKKATGIPRSFLKPVTGSETPKSSVLLPGGGLAVVVPNECAIHIVFVVNINESLNFANIKLPCTIFVTLVCLLSIQTG